MKKMLPWAALAALFAAPLLAQDETAKEPHPSPGEIVAAAPASDWVAIAPSDLMVMTLPPIQKEQSRKIVIQLMPAPFSQGWVGNIRKLVAARWYDGISVNRVQDNYVAQWGDAEGEDAAKAKPLPEGLAVVSESEYETDSDLYTSATFWRFGPQDAETGETEHHFRMLDPYASSFNFVNGLPLGHLQGEAGENGPKQRPSYAPVHCYGMVGVGRGYSPDTGSGAELYTVIGHAPRHLDRNIALVGRVIEGIEHLSSLPRGTGPLGFYESAEERVPILSVRMGNEVEGLPAYEYLSTTSDSFARYADARANRRDPFFIRPAGGADICNIPVPVRRKGN